MPNESKLRKRILKLPDLIFINRLTKSMRDPRTPFDQREFVEKGQDYLFNYVNRNVTTVDEKRRNFLKAIVIGVGVAAVAGLVPGLKYLPAPSVSISGFPKMLLVDSTGSPLKASQLSVNEPIITIYYYPLNNEPNFLINLGDSSGNPVAVEPATVKVPLDGSTYSFPGGVGPNKSIVSYSAICQHLGCQPPEIHFYPPEYMKVGMAPPAQLDASDILAAREAKIPGVIHCDCHGSTYDPYHGASVLTGPTQRPLPAVVLEWDSATDYLYAVNEVGVPVYGHSSDLSSGSPLSGDSTQVTQTTNPFS